MGVFSLTCIYFYLALSYLWKYCYVKSLNSESTISQWLWKISSIFFDFVSKCKKILLDFFLNCPRILQNCSSNLLNSPQFWASKCCGNPDMLYYSWDMARDRCNCHFAFWASFCPFTPLTAQKNQNFKKMKKKAWRNHHFTYSSWNMVRNGQTDGWKKWHIEVGVPPKNQEHMHRWYKMSTWAGVCQKKSSNKIARFSVILHLSIKKLCFCANFALVF